MTSTPSINGMVPLTHWGVIRAHGADAASFLHTQLTNDITGLTAGQARLAGYCSAKGRLLASFIVWKAGNGDILLACHASVLPATLKRLSMFVLRAKCKLSDASAELPLVGVAGVIARSALSEIPLWGVRQADGGQWIRLPDAAGTPRAMAVGVSSTAEGSDMTLDAWRWLEVQSGVPVIEAATAEHFVPQMINFELAGGVNFQKGCYPGQEIVARAQYRGTVKRRMFLFDADTALQAGQEIFHADDSQPAGQIANAAPKPSGDGCSALVEVKLSALAGGVLRAGAPDGPALLRRDMPYAVPIDADQAA